MSNTFTAYDPGYEEAYELADFAACVDWARGYDHALTFSKAGTDITSAVYQSYAVETEIDLEQSLKSNFGPAYEAVPDYCEARRGDAQDFHHTYYTECGGSDATYYGAPRR